MEKYEVQFVKIEDNEVVFSLSTDHEKDIPERYVLLWCSQLVLIDKDWHFRVPYVDKGEDLFYLTVCLAHRFESWRTKIKIPYPGFEWTKSLTRTFECGISLEIVFDGYFSGIATNCSEEIVRLLKIDKKYKHAFFLNQDVCVEENYTVLPGAEKVLVSLTIDNKEGFYYRKEIDDFMLKQITPKHKLRHHFMKYKIRLEGIKK